MEIEKEIQTLYDKNNKIAYQSLLRVRKNSRRKQSNI